LLVAPLILLVSPSLIAKNLKSTDQVLIATVAYCFVVLLAMIFPATGFCLYKRRPIARSIALISAVALLPICWPLGVYTWWFMHSEGGRRMYKLNSA
jgi:Ni,Fe-hydrogenase I cytochrome b subunit